MIFKKITGFFADNAPLKNFGIFLGEKHRATLGAND